MTTHKRARHTQRIAKAKEVFAVTEEAPVIADPPIAEPQIAFVPGTPAKPNTSAKVQTLAKLHERLTREWEHRRSQVFKEIGLTAKERRDLKAAREQFYQATELSLVDLQASTDRDEIGKEMSGTDLSNDAYDNYVKNLLGEERFSVLEDALAKMNSKIEKTAPHKFVFVSAW